MWARGAGNTFRIDSIFAPVQTAAVDRHQVRHGYSLDDIQVMRTLGRQHSAEVRKQFDSWREGWAFSAWGMALWCVGVASAFYLIIADEPLGIPPDGTLLARVAGWVLVLGTAPFFNNAIEFASKDQCWDAFHVGYSEGLREGVHRALNISHAQEEKIAEAFTGEAEAWDAIGAVNRMNREWQRP